MESKNCLKRRKLESVLWKAIMECRRMDKANKRRNNLVYKAKIKIK
jgi:hypothetical protein